MTLSETEKKLRDEIAKELFIKDLPKNIHVESEKDCAEFCFNVAESFIKAQRQIHEQDKQSDSEEWGGKPPSGTGPMTSKPNEGGSS